jgi:hypothetical protein
MILKSPDRASSRGKDAPVMKGAGKLARAAAVTFFGDPADLHFGKEEGKR